MQTKDDDVVTTLFVANTHTQLLFFTTDGMVYKLKTWRLPLGGRTSRGKAIVNILPIPTGVSIAAIMPVDRDEEEWDQLQIFFATTEGDVRRNALSDFTNVKSNGKIAMKLADGDRLVGQGWHEFAGGQHAETQQVDLDQPEVGAVLLVPLDDDAAGHRGRLEGDHLVEPTQGDHHSPRVLAQVPGQILDLLEETGEQTHRPVVSVEPGPLQPGLQGVAGVHVLEAAHVVGEAVDLLGGDPQYLANLSRGALVAVGDDVGGHGRSRRPVAGVDVLDDPLPAVPAGKIEVDVRPLPTLLRQETLEQQLHPHRVHRGDAEAVAHRAVGRGAPPLGEDPLPPAEVHEVPDDEEVPRELQLPDEPELALDLSARLLGVRPVALARPRLRHPAEERELTLPRRHRVVGELVAQILERELEPRGPVRESVPVDPMQLMERVVGGVAHGRQSLFDPPVPLPDASPVGVAVGGHDHLLFP